MQQALLKMKDVRSVTSSSDNTGERQKIWQAEGKKILDDYKKKCARDKQKTATRHTNKSGDIDGRGDMRCVVYIRPVKGNI